MKTSSGESHDVKGRGITSTGLGAAMSRNGSSLPKANHVVQLYESDAVLVDSVATFIGTGLATGEPALVIATLDHRKAVEVALEQRGFNVASLTRNGRYRSVDAEETLAQFMKGGMPDTTLFRQTVGTLVEEVSTTAGTVRLYGEMVAALWASGNADAALAVEQLWNVLGESCSFSLLCAYPTRAFTDSEQAELFGHVCAEHSEVVPAESFDSKAKAEETHRSIAGLQYKAKVLEAEVARRRQAEVELRRRENQLATFLESAAMGMHWVAEDGTILWANKAEIEMLGYSSEEYVGRHISEFHVDQDVIDDILARLTRDEKLHNYEARLRCKDGSIKTVLIDSTVLWEDGRFLHTQCFTRDVTQERLVDQANRHYTAIVESSDDAIVSKDLNGIIKSWNKGAERLFGYTEAEVIGKPITIIIPEDRLQEEPEILRRLQRGEHVDHFETKRRRKDGALLDISLTISPVHDAMGRVIGASKIARDITEQRKAQQALREREDELSRLNSELEAKVAERTADLLHAMERLNGFTYSVAHDLRQSIRGLVINAQLIRAEYSDRLDGEGAELLERLADAGKKMAVLVDDLLRYARVTNQEPRREAVDVSLLVTSIAEDFQAKYPGSQIRSQAGLTAVADPGLLRMVLENLIDNACKYVAPGAVPDVAVGAEGDAFYVQDKGIGFDTKYAERIFQPFERLHLPNEYQGNGIGLANVKRIIEKHQGKVWAESTPGHGSKFFFTVRPGSGSASV